MSIARKPADTSVDIHPVLAERWSPRAFESNVKLGTEDLTAILEAGRWAPSSNNGQPWRSCTCWRRSCTCWRRWQKEVISESTQARINFLACVFSKKYLLTAMSVCKDGTMLERI